MKNLLQIGRSLNPTELKEIMAGHVITHAGNCSAYGCGGQMACEVTSGECVPPGGGGGGGICPENPGMQC